MIKKKFLIIFNHHPYMHFLNESSGRRETNSNKVTSELGPSCKREFKTLVCRLCALPLGPGNRPLTKKTILYIYNRLFSI